jgi:hypothetical protein
MEKSCCVSGVCHNTYNHKIRLAAWDERTSKRAGDNHRRTEQTLGIKQGNSKQKPRLQSLHVIGPWRCLGECIDLTRARLACLPCVQRYSLVAIRAARLGSQRSCPHRLSIDIHESLKKPILCFASLPHITLIIEPLMPWEGSELPPDDDGYRRSMHGRHTRTLGDEAARCGRTVYAPFELSRYG